MNLNFGYVRTSTNDQASGLEMQENTILETAKVRDQKIDKIFKDEAMSGGNANRLGFNQLKQAIKDARQKYAEAEISVYVYDSSRIARDVIISEEFIRICWDLNVQIVDRNGSVKDFSRWESRFESRMNFVFATADKEKKNDDSKRGMRNALENGRYIFRPGPGQIKGYRYSKVDRVKLLTIYEPEASIVKETLEKYASGVLDSYHDVRRHLQENGLKCSNNAEYIKHFLTDLIYAGFLEHKAWNIPITKALHEPLITWDTHLKIVARIEGAKKAIYVTAKAEEFLLRGFVCCSECEHTLRPYWAKGTHKKYKYYYCGQKTCSLYRKDLSGAKMEANFLELLKELKPDEWMLETARQTFEVYWQDKHASQEAEIRKNTVELKKIESDLGKYLDRILKTEIQSVVRKYEYEIDKLELRKIEVMEKLGQNTGEKAISSALFRTMTETVLKMFKNLDTYWTNGSDKTKAAIMHLVFDGAIICDIGLNFRTVGKADILGFFSTLKGGNSSWWSRLITKTNDSFNIIEYFVAKKYWTDEFEIQNSHSVEVALVD
jgi:site-specific DNA recombinase